MFSEGSPYFARSLAGLVMFCSVTALSPWPMAFSARLALCDIAMLIVSVGEMLRFRLVKSREYKECMIQERG